MDFLILRPLSLKTGYSQYCWTNSWNCLWRGHSVYRNRPLIPLKLDITFLRGGWGGVGGGGQKFSIRRLQAVGKHNASTQLLVEW